MKFFQRNPFTEHYMKAETEGYDEDEEQNSELSDSLEDLYEHDNEDA